MSRLIYKTIFAIGENIVCQKTVRLNAVLRKPVFHNAVRRDWICLPLIVVAMSVSSPSLSLALQNDQSVLVFEDTNNSAGSNAQVEIEAEFSDTTDSRETFQSIPASTQRFLPPSPPVEMAPESDDAANFRPTSQGTQTVASKSLEIQTSAEPLRPTFRDEERVSVTATEFPSADSGTFTSHLPSETRLPNGSAPQIDNSFGSSPASSDLRSASTRNRFGDFGASPAPRAKSRFAPISSSSSIESEENENAPPVQPPINRFPQPAASPPRTQHPARPTATSNRFGSPAPTTSNRFAQPAQPKAAAPQPSHTTAPAIATPPASAPVISARTHPIEPQASSHSVTSLNDSPHASGRFPASPANFGNASSSSSPQSNSRQTNPRQPSSLQPRTAEAGSFGGSSLRPNSNSSLRSTASSESGHNSNSNSSSNPMIRRQTGSSSSSSFPHSSGTEQTSSASSRLSPQTRGFANQSEHQPLRGTPINNDLRGNPSNNQTQRNQRTAQSNNLNQTNPNQPNPNQQSGSQSDGKADRESINFAKQQLRNLQSASADLDSTPVRLQEMFLEPLSVSQRKKMVAQYWETYYDLAALKIATDYEGWVNSLSTSGSEQGLLSAAQQMAADQQLAAKIQLGKSKSRLMDFMPNPRPSGFTPRPADEPLVEHYVTDYEKYKRVRTLPSSLRGIDPMLASTLKLITQRAATVSIAKNAADQAGQAVRNRQMPLASAIAAGQLWRDSQLDMIASTVSYNQAISDFVLTLEPNRSPEQLTAFMLGTPKNDSQSNSTNPQNQINRSAANQPGFSPNRQQFR